MATLFNNDEEYTASYKTDDGQTIDIAAIRATIAETAKLVIGVTSANEEYYEIALTPKGAQTLHNHLKEQDVQDILGLA